MDRDFFLNSTLPFNQPSQFPSHNDTFNNLEPSITSILSSPVSTFRNSIPLSPNLPSLVSDPGFAERAAKFSCFGSRSFNDRNSSNPDLQFRSSISPLAKLPRVSSSPLLKNDGSAMGIHRNKNLIQAQFVNGSGGSGSDDIKSNFNEESSVSKQMDSKSRKRKAKENAPAIVKEEGNEDLETKKQRKTEDDKNGETEKKSKVPEPPKDYIHVRARRGQATDSHSLAERVRREKISERMKLLQDLVPGCNKVTGKAVMLDEIINYVQSLQHQVEFLSMKLATLNPRQDLDMNSHISKDINNNPNGNLSQQLYPTMESSTSDFYEQNPQQVLFIGSTPITHSPLDPSLLPVHGFTQAFSQFAGFEGDDLHSIVKMGFGEDNDHMAEMKIEL